MKAPSDTGLQPASPARAAGNRPALPRLLARALTLRCPQCGGRGVLRSWFKIRDECPTCGTRLGADTDFWLGAFVVNFVVSEGLLALFIALAFVTTLPDPPVALLAFGGGILMIVFPLAFFPFSRTIWAAIDLSMRSR